jgi:RNA polymerase sigma-70 factor (TIGR02943 family)
MELNSENKNVANPVNWVGLYSALLFKHALPRVEDRFVAEDLVQETFLAGLQGIEGFKGESSEKNWLFSILKHKIVDYYRKKSKQQDIVSMPDLRLMDNEWFNEDGSWAEEKIPHDWDSANNPTERKEIQKVIYWCKDHLKALQQSVFTLKYLEDIPSDEICKVLNITSTNYWILIHRARLKMRDCVEKMLLKN